MSRRVRRALSTPAALHAAVRDVLWGYDACVVRVDCSRGEVEVTGYQDERAAFLACPGFPDPCWVASSEPTDRDCARIVEVLREWHAQDPSALLSWDVWRTVDDILREGCDG